MQTKLMAVFIVVLSATLVFPTRVSAESVREIRQEMREARKELQEARKDLQQERKDLFQELRARISSGAGYMRNFLGLGRAAIGTGTITAKTDTTLTIEKDGKTYTVHIDSHTKLRRRYWGKSDIAEFAVGHVVNVIGLWADEQHTAINAKLIRNISIQKRFGVFFGVVKSLTSDGWVMSTKSGKRADQTVTISASTTFVNRRGDAITQADVHVGHRVRVKGLWDRSQNTVTEVVQVKDFSLPPLQPEVVPTATATPTAAP